MLRRTIAVIAGFGVLAAFAGAAAPVIHNNAGAVASGSPTAQTKEKKDDVWLLTTEPQMQVEVEKYLKNPRATYFIIMRAQRHNLGPAAAIAYRDWRKKRVGDPFIESAYAFSQWMAAGELTPHYLTKNVQPLLQQLRGQQMEARYYRTEAFKARPNSPEVLLETAVGSFFSPADTYAGMTKNKEESAANLRRAARLAPDWADAHYWLGRMLGMLWPVVPNKASIANESIHALQTAEKLNPMFHDDCLYVYATDYEALERPDMELRYVQAYLKAHPKTSHAAGILRWQAALEKQLRKGK